MEKRKIRMTHGRLISMPASYDEIQVTPGTLALDPEVCTAWAEMVERVNGAVHPGTRAYEQAWNDAMTAAMDDDMEALRAALTRARQAKIDAGYGSLAEDAALALLPGAERPVP